MRVEKLMIGDKIVSKRKETTGGTKYLPNYAYDHWQDVRERAAIAAMQGLLANPQLFYDNGEEKINIEAMAMYQTDELVRRLKGE